MANFHIDTEQVHNLAKIIGQWQVERYKHHDEAVRIGKSISAGPEMNFYDGKYGIFHVSADFQKLIDKIMTNIYHFLYYQIVGDVYNYIKDYLKALINTYETLDSGFSASLPQVEFPPLSLPELPYKSFIPDDYSQLTSNVFIEPTLANNTESYRISEEFHAHMDNVLYACDQLTTLCQKISQHLRSISHTIHQAYHGGSSDVLCNKINQFSNAIDGTLTKDISDIRHTITDRLLAGIQAGHQNGLNTAHDIKNGIVTTTYPWQLGNVVQYSHDLSRMNDTFNHAWNELYSKYPGANKNFTRIFSVRDTSTKDPFIVTQDQVNDHHIKDEQSHHNNSPLVSPVTTQQHGNANNPNAAMTAPVSPAPVAPQAAATPSGVPAATGKNSPTSTSDDADTDDDPRMDSSVIPHDTSKKKFSPSSPIGTSMGSTGGYSGSSIGSTSRSIGTKTPLGAASGVSNFSEKNTGLPGNNRLSSMAKSIGSAANQGMPMGGMGGVGAGSGAGTKGVQGNSYGKNYSSTLAKSSENLEKEIGRKILNTATLGKSREPRIAKNAISHNLPFNEFDEG